MKAPIVLTGLDGMNPLGFMAAIGLLRVLDERQGKGEPPRLSWRNEGRWRPVLHGPESLDAVVVAVVKDLDTWRNEPVLQLRYAKEEGGTEVYDLKPPPEQFRTFLSAAATGSRRTADFAAAYASDLVRDGKGATKPTALHFTAGQQLFLDMVRQLAEGVREEHFREALAGPWQRTSRLPSLSWDATVDRSYALRASNPSDEKRGSVPGADWLAFQALPLFPVAAVRSELRTTCCFGGWKRGQMCWPLWEAATTLAAVRSLLRMPGLGGLSPRERRGRGIALVLTSAIERSDQGGYGSFRPAQVG